MDSDSDFYGDEEDIHELESRVAEFNPADYWRDRSLVASSSPARAIKQEPSSSHSPASSSAGMGAGAGAAANQLHNPYEGRPSCAKQLSETTDAFLARLPPSTTDAGPDCPWIFVANPFIPREDRGGQEAPAEFGAQLGRFVEGGEARLEMLGDLVRELQEKTAAAGGSQRASQRGSRGAGPSKAAVSREVAKQREGCANDILMLAKMLKVRTGKWMLFVDPALVDDVWATVARATVRNELGIAAKVAPREGGRGASQERLVCIYTYDFSDQQDVGRVLGRLRELELVRTGPGRRPIYYKADAYTYLGIASGNHWGLKASLFSSSEIFAQIKEREGKVPAKQMKKEEEKGGREADAWTF